MHSPLVRTLHTYPSGRGSHMTCAHTLIHTHSLTARRLSLGDKRPPVIQLCNSSVLNGILSAH